MSSARKSYGAARSFHNALVDAFEGCVNTASIDGCVLRLLVQRTDSSLMRALQVCVGDHSLFFHHIPPSTPVAFERKWARFRIKRRFTHPVSRLSAAISLSHAILRRQSVRERGKETSPSYKSVRSRIFLSRAVWQVRRVSLEVRNYPSTTRGNEDGIYR